MLRPRYYVTRGAGSGKTTLAMSTSRRPGLRNLYGFVTSQPAYYRKPARPPTGPADWDALSRAATMQLLARRDDVVVLRSPREVRRFRRRAGVAGRPLVGGSS